MSSVILKIKEGPEEIRIVAKNGPEVSIHTINIKFIMATLWWEGTPQLETFFNILELTIKRAINEVYPHDKLVLNYTYSANDNLEEASEIIVDINQVEVDDQELELEVGQIHLYGNDGRGFFRKLTSFRRKTSENVVKEI
ncbi:MAG TPA: hypothetical protein VK444_04260 [Methanobacteriaceae archaeon]|nr:hypothetical protein [Methanobacteriaceae archaeon]